MYPSLILVGTVCAMVMVASVADQYQPPTAPRVCSWHQPNIHNKEHIGEIPQSCDFMVRDLDFWNLLGRHPRLEFVTRADAHEGGVYLPGKEEFYFSTSKSLKPYPNAQLMKLSLNKKTVSTVFTNTSVANGMVLDLNGDLLICQQGVGKEPGFIQKVDLLTLNSTVVADNWFGFPFNSPNDAVVKSDGSIWFTDPDYGWVQEFKNTPRLNNQVYRISPSGEVDAVADSFIKPNGLAFSQDEKRLYVTDTGSVLGDSQSTVIRENPHSVTVFDVSNDGKTLTNRRLFASIACFDGRCNEIAVADGIKVDKRGRVYIANMDGIQVLDNRGRVLGLIRIPGASNMGFAGRQLDRLLIMNGSAIHEVRLLARGAGLHYATSRLGLSG